MRNKTIAMKKRKKDTKWKKINQTEKNEYVQK